MKKKIRSKKRRSKKRHTRRVNKGGQQTTEQGSDEFKTILEHYFGEIWGKIGVENRNSSNRYSMLYNGNMKHSTCFNVDLEQDSLEESRKTLHVAGIKYPNETNCLLKGPEILIRLYHAAMDMKLRNIELQDASQIHYHGSCSYSLAKYYILLHGHSWYNTFGYSSKEHKKELVHNEKIRSSPLSVYMAKYPNLCNKIIEKTGCTSNNTIKEIVIKCDKLLQSKEITKCGTDGIVTIFQRFLDISDVNYYPYLSLDLTNPDTVKIYNKKIKKLHSSSRSKNNFEDRISVFESEKGEGSEKSIFDNKIQMETNRTTEKMEIVTRRATKRDIELQETAEQRKAERMRIEAETTRTTTEREAQIIKEDRKYAKINMERDRRFAEEERIEAIKLAEKDRLKEIAELDRLGQSKPVSKLKENLDIQFGKLSKYIKIKKVNDKEIFTLDYDGYEMFQIYTDEVSMFTLRIYNIENNKKYNLLRGKEILTKLYYSAKDSGFKFITVDEDDSQIIIKDCRHVIDLPYYYIGLYGYSWFNKMGYYSNHNFRDKKFNNEIFNENQLRNLRGGETHFVEEELDFDNHSSIREVLTKIFLLLRAEGADQCAIYTKYSSFFELVESNLYIKYTSLLTLDLNNTKTAAIYALSKT